MMRCRFVAGLLLCAAVMVFMVDPSTALAQGTASRVDHIALGAAHVHAQHMRFHQMADRAQAGLGSRHRHGQQDDVGARDGQQRRLSGVVDHTQLARALGGRGRLAVADDAFDQARFAQGQREGAAHQAATDEAELIEHQCTSTG